MKHLVRDVDRLRGCAAELIAGFIRIKLRFEQLFEGHEVIVTSGRRTAEEQHKLFQQGRELPGAVVTNCDGYEKISDHQTGEACDVAILDPAGQPVWSDDRLWPSLRDIVISTGLKSGATWGDWPHVSL